MKIISLCIVVNLFFLSTKETKQNYVKVTQETNLQQSINRGKEIYADMCATCHLPNGEGVAKVYPPLAKSDYLMEKREASIRAIKYGLKGKIVVNGVTYKGMMANLGLYEDEVADVMNYITNSWGNKNPKMVTEKEVKKIQKKED
ncbi:cytochrome c [uncultured Polaribacter sp.]|uniref:c-type cytochrome n=1 Tax=uncultured Polaribacter sp. TaxID=174711 RepID=UPI0026075B70|nr:cytochrome c [uncultured Polaribacter sp.]